MLLFCRPVGNFVFMSASVDDVLTSVGDIVVMSASVDGALTSGIEHPSTAGTLQFV